MMPALAGPPLRLLLVDDDEIARRATSLALQSFGFHCDLASSGDEAFEKHRAHPYDVIVSDWRMPEGDGIALCRKIRASSEKYVYFVLVTAHGDKQTMLEGMNGGADAFIAKPVDMDELHARLIPARRIMDLQNRWVERNRAARRDSQRLYVAARIDALTQLRNRRALDDDLISTVAESIRYARPCSCAMIDIDEFKICNDAFGHLTGDQVLRRVADSVRASLRKSDVVYRYGGEELFVVLPEQTAASACAAMERVLADIESLRLPQGPSAQRPFITVSAGVAELRGKTDISSTTALHAHAQAWIARADVALYRAKNTGRNRVVCD